MAPLEEKTSVVEKKGDSETDAKKKGDSTKNELSEEDKALQEELETAVEQLESTDAGKWENALELLRSKLRESTNSMTSVPKPMKFLMPHFDKLKDTIYNKMTPEKNQKLCADVVSVMSMVCSEKNDCLKFRKLGSQEDIGSWGHEYVLHVSSEVGDEWSSDDTDDEKRALLKEIVDDIVPYFMKHNAESDACDILMETECLDDLVSHTDENTYNRVCLYLTSCVKYVAEPENTNLLKCAYKIYRKFDKLPDAMRLSMCLNDTPLMIDVLESAPSTKMQKQLCFMLGRQQIYLELETMNLTLDETDIDELKEIMTNGKLNGNFFALARELDIMEPKLPADIYKAHLETNKYFNTGNQPDSARQNLASSFVNGFINCGFGSDKLLLPEDAGNKWIYKNKEHGMMSATASLGCLLLWDVDGGLTKIDKYLYSTDDYIKSGALLACGIVSSGIMNECEPALALLSDYVLSNNMQLRICSCFGLGLAYCGSNRDDVLDLIKPVLTDKKSTPEVMGVAGIALGMISVGHANASVSECILAFLMEKTDKELANSFMLFLALALGLNYLGLQEESEATIAALEVVKYQSEMFQKVAALLLEICSYATTGNVLKIQKLLHICSESAQPEEKSEEKPAGQGSSQGSEKKADKKDDKSSSSKDDKSKKEKEKDDSGSKIDPGLYHSVATLGLAIIANGEDIGSEMATRTFGHLLRYGETSIRKAVPLALAMLSPSNPQLPVLDTLSKFSHDTDAEVSANSILAMGILGCGTNNARLALMLRQLAQYYAKDANNLFMTRISQGLTHMGKGTLTINAFHCDRLLCSNTALAGVMTLLVSCLNVKETILGEAHYLLYSIVPAIQPRMLTTFDENLNPLPVSVRVGQAVDVVGQAGKPKTITGFQTHTTPVLLNIGERAELATDEYRPLTPFLEGFVILEKNPDYKE